jgi:kinesin family protein 1
MQKTVFKDVGLGILENAWKGFNTSLFAYGQTGSGKSWSVIGYGPNKGIVPMLCEELFKGIKDNREGASYEVKFSMLEIYNEVARDLLDPKATGKKSSGLKIRQHPKRGFYGKNSILKTVIHN